MLFTLSAIRIISPYTLARRWERDTVTKADGIRQETMGSLKMSTKAFLFVQKDVTVQDNI